MTKFVSKLILALLVVNTCQSVPVSEDKKVELTPQEQEYAEDYFNFTLGVDEALDSFEDHNDVGRWFASQGASAVSPFGIGYILATVKENVVPTSVPGFENALKSSRNLPEAYSQLLGKILGSDIKISNLIFTSDTLPDAPALKTLKAEVKNVNLQSSDAASQINSDISAKTENSVPYTYIPPKATLPQSTKAILISTVHLNSAWPTPLAKVATSSFNGGETVDMYEIKGAFPYLESDDALQVTIPFKNDARALVLILPSDMNAARKGEIAEPRNGTAPLVRVQFPLFAYTVRVPHKAAKSEACTGFTKSENFFRMLNDVVHISATVDTFQATSITGAMINNVEQYKKETPVTTTQNQILPVSSSPAGSAASHGTKKRSDTNPAEKLIVLDKPFQWRVDDMIMGPIFFGTVESLNNAKMTSDDSATTTVFGLDDLSYINCL